MSPDTYRKVREAAERYQSVAVPGWDGLIDLLDAVNQVMNQPVHTSGKWKGNVLELVSNVRVMTTTLLMTERWSLTDAGRTLVIERESDSPLGKRRSRMLYHRE